MYGKAGKSCKLQTEAERTSRIENAGKGVENLLLSFSQPNFYFNATTAYAILRWKALPVGKRDFAGMPRLKG